MIRYNSDGVGFHPQRGEGCYDATLSTSEKPLARLAEEGKPAYKPQPKGKK